LEVQSAVFDADAPELTPPVKNPGLPWMKDKNGSNGPGQNGIGDGHEHGMGVGQEMVRAWVTSREFTESWPRQ